jgi:enoyl-CoA hydratase/carnithine racemase
MSDDSHLLYEVQDHIAKITLNRPEAHNAYSEEMVEHLVATIEHADGDSEVRCIVLTGAGKSFSAGGDLKAMRDKSGMFAGGPMELRERYIAGIQTIPRAIAVCATPIVAAVNGAAIGAGLDLACMADVRVASSRAKFGSTFVKVGLIPGDGGCYFLARAIGFGRALEMILSARVLDAAEALTIGLVHQVAEPEALIETAMRSAEAICANAPIAVQMAKKAAYRSHGASMQEALEMAATYQGLVQNTADHAEAVKAMLEKRAPVFEGR